MNPGTSKTRLRSQKVYGTMGNTSKGFDRRAFNVAFIENLHEPLLSNIRQQRAETGRFTSKFREISRIRRRPILRTKSESDFPLVNEATVEEIRDKLIRDHKSSFHLKSVPTFGLQQKLVLVSLAIVDFTSFCSMSILAPFFPQKAEEKNMSTTVSGFIFSVYALAVFVASPMMGYFVSKVGPKFVLLIGVIVCGVCNILFGLLDQVESSLVFTIYCFVVRIFEAVGAAAFSTASYTYVAKLFPDNIGAVLGILETFVGLGLSVGPAIGGVLYDWGGYELPFISLGGLLLLTVPVNIFLLPGNDTVEDEADSESMWKLFRIQPIIVISLIVVVVSNAWGFLDPTLASHLSEFNFSAKQLGLFFLLCSALYGLSSPIWGYIADQMTRTWILMVIGLILSSFGLLLLGPSPVLPIVNSIGLNIIALIILGLSISMALLPTFESMLDFAIDGGYPDDVRLYGLIAGLWSSMYSLGEVIGPSLGASLMDHFGFPVCSTVMAAICFTSAIFVLVYFMGFYRVPPLSTLLAQRANFLTETSDSGISDSGDEDNSSSTSSTSVGENTPLLQTTIITIEDPPYPESTNTVLDSKSPTIRVPSMRRYSLSLYVPDYTSEIALPDLARGNHGIVPKMSSGQYKTPRLRPPSITVDFPRCETFCDRTNDSGTSYSDVIKTISITATGALEI